MRQAKCLIYIINQYERSVKRAAQKSWASSDRAGEVLAAEGDTNYVGYDEAVQRLAEEFGQFTEADWNRNLYWSWLYALKPLLQPLGAGYPTFMQTPAWADKSLATALASWAELRHDTILYAKQSYTFETGMPPEPPAPGYVEPGPEFYARLLALTQMTERGLSDLGVLSKVGRTRLQNLSSILQRLVDISLAELRNERLSDEDYAFIRGFADSLEQVVLGVEETGVKTTLVADVHTDLNSGQALEEGVGYVKLLLAAVRLPDNQIVLAAGPVLSYYEFKHPLSDRLTDEAWRAMLQAGQTPARPPWTASFWTE